MLQSIRKIVRSRDEGASAVEYGLLVAGIAVVIIAAVFLLGENISAIFNDSANCITSTASGTC